MNHDIIIKETSQVFLYKIVTKQIQEIVLLGSWRTVVRILVASKTQLREYVFVSIIGVGYRAASD